MYLPPRVSIGILLGRYMRSFPTEPAFDPLEGVEDIWRTQPDLMRKAQPVVGQAFGTVVQTASRTRVYRAKPALYFALHCTHCGRPLGEGCNYRQLLGFRRHPERGCSRQDCMAVPQEDWLKALCLKHASLQNYAKVGITLSLYKLLLPELVPSTYGGCYGMPRSVAYVPTPPDVALAFCNQMRDGRPYSRIANAGMPYLSFREILEPNEARWSATLSERLEMKLLHPETTFFLNEEFPAINYIEMEMAGKGTFINYFCRQAKLKHYCEIDEENEVMVSIQKVENSAVQAMTSDSKAHGIQSKIFDMIVSEAAKLPVGESLLVSGADETGAPLCMSNLHGFVKKRGLVINKHIRLRRQFYDAEGVRITRKDDRGYVVTKLAEFPDIAA